MAGTGRQRRATMSGLRIAVPRGALFTDTLDLLDRLGIDTREVRDNDRKLLFDDGRDRHDATVRRPDLRRGRSGRPRYHRQGRADGAVRARGLRAVDLGYGRCPMVLASVDGRGSRGGGAAAARGRPDRDQIPADRGAPLPRDRSPGGDRRGQGLGRAGAADRARRGDRRPDRDRDDVARERARRPRGDRGLHRAPDRQSGRPQAAGAETIDGLLERVNAV